MMEDMQTASRERRVRRIAQRRGYQASLSKVRDHAAPGFGRWTVTGPGGRLLSGKRGWTLEQVEAWIERMAEVS
jgi:hypothetical protein